MEYIFLGIFCELIGIPIFLVGINFHKKDKKGRKGCTSKSFGKVIDYFKNEENLEESVKDVFYYPIFEYKVKQTKVVQKSKYGHTMKPYKIGQKVKIYYNPNNYNDYYVVDEMLESYIYLMMIIGSILVIIFGIAMFFNGIK